MTEETRVETYDPATLAENLRTKIRLEIAELMPPNVWQELLRTEINKFLEPTTKRRGSGYSSYSGTTPSGLETLVHGVLRDMLKEMLKKELSSPEWASFWDGQRQTMGPKMEQLVKDVAPDLMTALLKSAMSNFVSEVGCRV